MGFAKTDADLNRERVMKALEDFLRPEFLGRVDEVVIFAPLGADSLKRIAGLMLDEIKPVLEEKGIRFEYTSKVCDLLAELAGNGKRGARDLRRVVRKQVEDKIASILVEDVEEQLVGISATVKDEKIVLKTV